MKMNRNIIRNTAEEIAKVLSYCEFDNVADSSGCYVITEFSDGTERWVDVYKSTGDGAENPHYVIHVGYEDDDFDWQCTKDLSVDALENELMEIANDLMAE